MTDPTSLTIENALLNISIISFVDIEIIRTEHILLNNFMTLILRKTRPRKKCNCFRMTIIYI